MAQQQVAQHRFGSVSISARGRLRLLAGVSASAAALALSLAPQQARAQAVNGTPTVVFGADPASRTPTSDSFNVTANEALIDWAVTDPAVFLNAATTLGFARDGGAYTVLNRVVSSPSLASTLALNGRVQSDSQGRIWFYNPGGWAVGAGATIDVGSLLLSASPVTVDTFDPGNPGAARFLGDNGEIRLGQASVAGAAITIDPLASIAARGGDNSYIALVAPRVVQAGVVSGAGSVAYVGAEAADITINNGLFDIAVTVGTTDPNGVVHTGTTTGPSSFGSTPRTQFLVAVGKNDALTMLVRGRLGYDAASSAGFVNGRIVLSSGQGIVANDPAAFGAKRAGISLSSVAFQSDLIATASDRIGVSVASAGQSVSVTGNAALAAKTAIDVSVSGNVSEFAVSGDLTLAAQDGAVGGAVNVGLSSGGSLLVDGNFTATADGFGAALVDPQTFALLPGGVGAAGRGGTVVLTATSATLQVGGTATLSADARGGIGGASAGSATAGTVSLTGTGSTISTGALLLYARAFAANGGGRSFGGGTTGASSTGGDVTLDLTGGATLGSVGLDNSAQASFGTDDAPQAASTGDISLRLAGGTYTATDISLASNIRSVDGGAATGGAQDVTITGAAVTVTNGLAVFGQVVGDVPATPGAAGSASLTVTAGGTLSVPNVSLNRQAIGTAAGKTVTGGSVALTVNGGGSVATTGGVFLSANARGFQQGSGPGPGGSGTGGSATITVAGGTLSAGSQINAEAAGFAGGNFDGVVTNETGLGGTVSLNLSGANASIAAPTIGLFAPGLSAPSEGTLGGSTGIGGTVTATIGGGLLTTGELTFAANGEGGFGSIVGEAQTPMNGGMGRGGSVNLAITGGTVDSGAVKLQANGEGGSGANSFEGTEATAGRGGEAMGGSAALALSGGSLQTSALTVAATGNAPEVFDFGEGGFFVNYYGAGGHAFGDGGIAGAGGNGRGGNAGIVIDGGELRPRGSATGASVSVTLDASGVGGNGGSTGGATATSTKGDGGAGTGGSATFAYSAGNADFLGLVVDASGTGGIGGFENRSAAARAPAPIGSSDGADGGDGMGGSAAVVIATDLGSTSSGGSTRFIVVDASGTGGSAADGAIAGNGGNGRGGRARLEVIGGTVDLVSPLIDASGSGGSGGRPGLSNPGGDGGAGFGGDSILGVSNGAALTLTGGLLSAGGFGAAGRTGSDGGGSGAPGDGGKGGDAKGGSATLQLNGGGTLMLVPNDGVTLRFDVAGFAGNGGLGGTNIFNDGNSYGDGGDGGTGAGGAIVVEVFDTTFDFGDATFDASGYGGNGGGRVTDEGGVAGEFSAGGDGGEAEGGSIRLTALGADATLSFSSLTARANGFAGIGANGQGIDAVTFAGAPGGAGLQATGGTITLEALDGGSVTVVTTGRAGPVPGPVLLEASGFAGVGGDGANGGTDPVTGNGGAGGNGGNSGQGNGGTITILADGGTISAGQLQVFALGEGRFGGFGGAGGSGMVPTGSPPPPPVTPPGSNGAFGAFGIGGDGIGGIVEVSALTSASGSVGGLSLGDTTIDVTGTINFSDQAFPSVGGEVSIFDRVDDSNGGLRFGSLSIDASGDVPRGQDAVLIESSDGPIVIDGNFSIAAAGDVRLQAFGTGGLAVGGFFSIDTQGTVEFHDDDCAQFDCPTTPTVSGAAGIAITASGGNVLLVGSPTLASDGAITIDAGGNITGGQGSGYRTPGNLLLSAGGDIAVRNAEVGFLRAEAGRFLAFVAETETVEIRYRSRDLTLGEAGGGGRIVVASNLSALAGGDVTVTSGAEITTGFGLSLASGDDIVIGSGASLTANSDAGAEPGSLFLDAGGVTVDDDPVPGNVASLIAGSGASIDGTVGAVQLIGGAIDTRGASISGSAVFADVRNPPASGAAQSNDNGQLAAPCLAGDICLGSVTADGQVRIGQGDDAPVRFLGTGNIAGGSVAITTRETLSFGGAASLSIVSNGAIVLQSQDGDIALTGGATLDGGTLDLAAGESLTGNGTLISDGDIGLTVGNNITANRITAAGQLTGFGQTGGPREASLSIPGNFTVTTLQLGADAAIAADGDIVVGSASLGGNDVDFAARGLVSLGSTAQVGDIALSGDRAAFGALVAGGSIAIDATNAVGGTSAIAGTTLSIDGATIAATTLRSGGAMALASTGATTLGSATSGAGLTIAAGPLAFTSLTSMGATTINAASIAGGDIAAGTALDVRSPGAIGLGTATASTTLALNGPTITATRLQSGQGMTLTSSGATTLGTAASGAGLTIGSGALTFGGLTSTGATTIAATSVAGGTIDAGTSLAVTTPGALQLGNSRAGTTLTLDGATIAAGTLTAGGNASLRAASVTASGIDSGARIDVTAPGAVSLGTTRSAGLTRIGAGTLALVSANAAGGLELTVADTATLGTVQSGSGQSGAGVTASARDLRFTAITASGTIAATATTIGGGDATSTAGAVALNSTGATTVGQLRAGTDVTVTASALTFAGINAARNATLDIGTLTGTAITAGQDLTIRSVNSLSFGSIGAGRNVSLSASNGALTVTTDLDAGGTIALSADAILVRAAGALRVNSASADNGDIGITTDGLLRVDSALAIGDIALTSTASSLIVGTAVAGDAPVIPSALNAGGTSQGTPGPGAIALAAANDITLLATVDANTSLAATAGGLIDQRALAVGKTVAYRSADIALGQGASLGQSNFTTGVVLTNTGSAGAILGDLAGTTAGYRLDNAEFGRVHSGGDLSLVGGSSLSVGTLAASAASGTGGVANGQIGATGTLTLSTGGELGVSGAFALGNAGGNTLRLTSGGALFVDAGSGSVRLVEGSGHGGTLAVSAGSVLALTPAARTAIVGLDTRALDRRLALNDGVTAGRTLLEAGAITIASNGAILIQNTSPGISFDERRGFVADSLSLITRSTGSTTGGTTSTTGLADIVINGTVNGTTGLTALRAVQIDGAFSDFSTINGCRILTASCGNPVIDPIRDLIEEEVEVGSTLDRGDGLGEGALIVIDRIEPAGFESVIDEPVTGAGNDDFLVPEAGAGDEECTEDDRTKCDKPPGG